MFIDFSKNAQFEKRRFARFGPKGPFLDKINFLKKKLQISILGEGIYQKSSIYGHYKALSKANRKDPFF